MTQHLALALSFFEGTRGNDTEDLEAKEGAALKLQNSTAFSQIQWLRILVCQFFALILVAPVLGQVEETLRTLPSRDEILEFKTQVEQDPNLDDSTRSRIISLYDQALGSVELAGQADGQAQRFEQERARIEQTLADLQEQLSQTPPEATLPDFRDGSLAEVESQLTRERALLSSSQSALRNVEELAEEQAVKRSELSRRLGALDGEIEAMTDDLRTSIVAGTNPELGRAMRLSLLARREASAHEMEALRFELELLDASGQLIPWQRDYQQRQIEIQGRVVELLEGHTREKREEENQRSLEEIRQQCRDVADRIPQLSDLAAETQSYAELLWGSGGVTALSEGIAGKLVRTRTAISELDRITEMTRRRYQTIASRGGLREWWPLIPENLPSLPESLAEAKERERLIPDAQYRVILFEEQRARLQPDSVEAESTVRDLASGSEEQRELQGLAADFFRARGRLLELLIQQYGRYSSQLEELDTVASSYILAFQRLNSFILERGWWTRTIADPFAPRWSALFGALTWLCSPDNWNVVFGAWFGSLGVSIAQTLALIVAFGLLIGFRPWVIRRMLVLAKRVSEPENDTLVATLEAAVHTVFLAAPVPLFCFVLASALPPYGQGTFTSSAKEAFAYISQLSAMFELTRQLLRPGGLAEAHFGRSPAVVRTTFGGLFWAEVLFLPAAFIAVLLYMGGLRYGYSEGLYEYSVSLGRWAFVIAFTLLWITLASVFRPRGIISTSSARRDRTTAFRRASAIAYPIILLTTVAPAVLALFGYLLLGYGLVIQTMRMAWLAIGVALLAGLLFRLRATSRRGAVLRPARPGQSGLSPSTGEEGSTVKPNESVSVEADIQVTRLLRFAILLLAASGVYSIWADALPAMQALKRVQLLPTIQVLDEYGDASLNEASPATGSVIAGGSSAEATTDPTPATMMTPSVASGSSDEAAESGPAVLTLWDLLRAILAAIITFALVTNLPGLIELLLARRTHLDSGARVAISTLIRYTIMIVGASAVFSLLGLSWSRVQWLAAALTFGLGFGLQEIVANFVSGLILLVERPIRVGDAVSVGNLQGRVNQIQIRATTITLWDRSEMVVPNKQFVTSQLVNWTLSDSRRRIEIPLFVEYGCRSKDVKSVLEEVARQHPNVLDDPPPKAVLIEFGENSIKLELRIYVEFGLGAQTKDEVQGAIEEAFEAEGINFAQPRLTINLPDNPPAG